MGARASAATAQGLQNFLMTLSQGLQQAGLYAEKRGKEKKQQTEFNEWIESLAGTGLVPETQAAQTTVKPAGGIYESPEMLAEDVRIAQEPTAGATAASAETPGVGDILRSLATNPKFLENPMIKQMSGLMMGEAAGQRKAKAARKAKWEERFWQARQEKKKRDWTSSENEEDRQLKRDLAREERKIKANYYKVMTSKGDRDKRLQAARLLESSKATMERNLTRRKELGMLDENTERGWRVIIETLNRGVIENSEAYTGDLMGPDKWEGAWWAIRTLENPDASVVDKRKATAMIDILEGKTQR